jgi:hypothetical protein
MIEGRHVLPLRPQADRFRRREGRRPGDLSLYQSLPGETPDSLRAVGDTTLTYVPFPQKAERVQYAAERIRYFADSQDLVLDEKARVDYKDSRLEADNITYHAKVGVLDANGSPTLTDAGQTIVGHQMDYDLDSETGLVVDGSTQYEQGYYSGKDLAKVGENELKVWNSWYTTCDLKEPHYHFAAKHMKVYPDDKAFSGPIWLYVGKTPIFALPFMANSISTGRRSGLLRPRTSSSVSPATGSASLATLATTGRPTTTPTSPLPATTTKTRAGGSTSAIATRYATISTDRPISTMCATSPINRTSGPSTARIARPWATAPRSMPACASCPATKRCRV